MKTLIAIITLITFTIPVFAQTKVAFSYKEVNKKQFDSCHKTSYLITNTQIKKQSGTLIIPVENKAARIFKDDNSNEGFHQFLYMGDVKGTKLSLVKRTDYNSEEFYFVNRTTGSIDTMIGLPVFEQNMQNFACINNPGTDEKQQIQIGEIRNGSVNTRGYLNGKADLFFEDISCINRSSILIKDNKGRYWRLDFNIGSRII